MLARAVAGATFICLEAGDRAQVDDVSVSRLSNQRETCACHAHESEHVDLPHLYPLIVTSLSDRVEAAGKSGIVDEHVDAPESLPHLADEGVDAFELGHIKGNRRTGLADHATYALDSAGARGDPVAEPTERQDGGGPNSRRGTRDDGNRPVAARQTSLRLNCCRDAVKTVR